MDGYTSENSNATVPARSTSGWTWRNPLDRKTHVRDVQNGLSRDSAERIRASYVCSLLKVMSHDCYSGITICYPGIAAIGWNCSKQGFCVADTSFWSTRHQFVLIIDNIIYRTRAHHNIVCSVENKINDINAHRSSRQIRYDKTHVRCESWSRLLRAIRSIVVGGRHFRLFGHLRVAEYVLYTYLMYDACNLCTHTNLRILSRPPAMKKGRLPKTMIRSTKYHLIKSVN